MTITTRFNEGDKAFTLNTATLKVKEFEVERVSTYTTNGKTSVTLYAKNAVRHERIRRGQVLRLRGRAAELHNFQGRCRDSLS